jgi:hypothetical protein
MVGVGAAALAHAEDTAEDDAAVPMVGVGAAALAHAEARSHWVEMKAVRTEAAEELAAANAAISEHLAKDAEMRTLMHAIIRHGNKIRKGTGAGGDEALRRAAMDPDTLLGSAPAIIIAHGDGSAGRQVPFTPLQITAQEMRGHRLSPYGLYNVSRGVMRNYLPDMGLAGEDSNFVMNVLLMFILQTSQGHEAMVIYLDCCAVSNNSYLNWFVHFVVDELKLLKVFGLVYFFNRHGKSFCDSRFGAHVAKMKNATVLGVDMFAQEVLESISNTHTREHDSCSIMHPTGHADLVAYAKAATDNLLPFHRGFRFTERGQHEVFAVRACHSFTGTEAAYFNQFVAPAGWVNTRSDPTAAMVPMYFLRPQRSTALPPPGPRLRHPQFTEPSATTAQGPSTAPRVAPTTAAAASTSTTSQPVDTEEAAHAELQQCTNLLEFVHVEGAGEQVAQDVAPSSVFGALDNAQKRVATIGAANYKHSGQNHSKRTDIEEVAKLMRDSPRKLVPVSAADGRVHVMTMAMVEREPQSQAVHESLLCASVANDFDLFAIDRSTIVFEDFRDALGQDLLPFSMPKPPDTLKVSTSRVRLKARLCFPQIDPVQWLTGVPAWVRRACTRTC